MKIIISLSMMVLAATLSLIVVVPITSGACSTAPLLVSPADGAQTSTLCPLLTWNRQSDPAATYSLMQVSGDFDFSSVIHSVSTSPAQGVTSFRFADNFEESTTYYWRSRLKCGSEDGPWSAVWSFRTPSGGTAPATPALISPPDGAVLPLGANPIKVEWSSVAGVEGYYVLREMAGSYSRSAYTPTENKYSWSSLNPDQSYSWKVKSRNSYAWSDYSPSRSFRQSLIIPSGDYDGDGSSDIALFRPDTGLWAIRGLTRLYFGSDDDLPASGDYNGDGTTQIALFRPSTGLWAIRNWSRIYFGGNSDIPIPADYNGDGNCDPGIFRGSAGLWAVRGVTRAYFGTYGDAPCPRDMDGDGTSAIALFRGSTGLWAYRGVSRSYFGTAGDWPVSASYDFGGAIPAIFRESSGLWATINGSRWYYGKSGDIPIPGDYNNSDRDTGAIFRPSSGLWSVRGVTRVYFGADGDLPVSR